MNDKDEQQHILDAIERLLAGEPLELAGVREEEKQRLLTLARELRQERPEPSTEFEERLGRKLERLAAGMTADAARKAGSRRRWLPEWITLPRVAAVSAALVLGLGIAGLTGAILEGQGDNGAVDKARVAGDTTGAFESEEADSLRFQEDAAGVAGAPSQGDAAVQSSDGLTGGGSAVIPTVRQIIQSADYEIEIPVGEFQEKYGKVTVLTAKYGGYVVSADTSASDDENAINSGRVTIRIADTGDNFAQAMSELDGLGRIISRDVSGKDVTDEYVDLQSRLRNAQAHEASLLALMAKATTIEEMLMVQSELNTVRSEIEQLQGQINYIADRSDFATINVYMYEEDVEKDENGDDGGTEWGFVESLKYAGWLAVQTVNFIIMALGVIIPVALILTIVIAVVYRLMQRRK